MKNNVVAPTFGLLLASVLLASCQVEPSSTDMPTKQEQNNEPSEVTSLHIPTLSTDIPQRDEARQVYPFDALFSDEILRLSAAAYLLVESECMIDKGYSINPVRLDPSVPRPETQSPGIGTIFNEQIAAKYGYRLAPDLNLQQRAEPSPEFGYDKLGDDQAECSFRAQAAVDGKSVDDMVAEMNKFAQDPGTAPDADVLNSIGSRINRLGIDPNFPGLQESASRWRTCMEPLGIADLPNEPWPNGSTAGLPGSLMQKWNYTTSGKPTEEEIAIATHDAQCRRSSGWFDVSYDALFTAQEQFFTENLDEIRPRIQAEQEKAQRCVEILAGKKK